jgi:hypothetical protein
MRLSSRARPAQEFPAIFTCHARVGMRAIAPDTGSGQQGRDLLDCADGRGFEAGQHIVLVNGDGHLLVGPISLGAVYGSAAGSTSLARTLQIDDSDLQAAGITDLSQLPVPFYIVAESVLLRFSDATPVPNTGERIQITGANPFWAYDDPTQDDARVRDVPLPFPFLPPYVLDGENLNPGTVVTLQPRPEPASFTHYGPFLAGTVPPLDPGTDQLCFYGAGDSPFSAQTPDRQPITVASVGPTPATQNLGGCLSNLPQAAFSAPLAIDMVTLAGWNVEPTVTSVTIDEVDKNGSEIGVERVRNTFAFGTSSDTLPFAFAAGQDYIAQYRQEQLSDGNTYEASKLMITNPLFSGVFDSLSCPGQPTTSDLSHDPAGTTITTTSGFWTLHFSPPLAAGANAVSILNLGVISPDTRDHECELIPAPTFAPPSFPVFALVTMSSAPQASARGQLS